MLNMVFAAKIGREVYFHDLIDRQCIKLMAIVSSNVNTKRVSVN